MANLKSRPASAPRRQLLPAATELDDPRPAVLGRGQRDPQPTERSLVFRESVARQNARLNASRERRIASASVAPSPRAATGNSPDVAPPGGSINATALLGFAAAEDDEIENDPLADEDEDIEDGNRDQDVVNSAQALAPLAQRNVRISTDQCTDAAPSDGTKKLARRLAVSRVPLPAEHSQMDRTRNAEPSRSTASSGSTTGGAHSRESQARTSQGTSTIRSNSAGGTKRSAPIEVSDDEETDAVVKRSKPKAGDYAGSRRAHLLRACVLFRIAISTRVAFPDGVELDQLAYDCFVLTDEDHDPRIEPTDDELKVIKVRASQLRGQVVTNAKSLVKPTYGFSSTDTSDATIEANRIKYDGFTERAAFTYEVPGVRAAGTLFKNPIFLEIAQKTWFRNRRDEGVVFHEVFNSGPGFPLPALALIVVAVKNGLDEWKTGVHMPIDFSEKGYADEYSAVLKTLHEWRDVTDNSGSRTAAKFQIEFLRRCRAAVGILGDSTAVLTNTQLTRDDILADDTTPANA